MTDMMEATSSKGVAGGPGSLSELAGQLMARAEAEGVSLVGPGGLLAGLTKTVLETALEAEMSECLGYEAHDPAGHNGGTSRNGTARRRS
jgi:transposase-like protein